MSITKSQEIALRRLSLTEWRSAYDISVSLLTLESLRRKWILLEISGGYCEIAGKRLAPYI